MHAPALAQAGEQVTAEVVRRVGAVGVVHDGTHEHVGIEHVESHRAPACSRAVVIDRRLLAKAGDAPASVTVDDAVARHLVRGNRDRGDGHLGAAVAVEGEHLADVHLVDVVGAEHADVGRLLVLDHVEVLEDGVGAAAEPLRAEVHRRRHGRNVVAHLRRELPAAREVLHHRARLVLGEDAHLEDARVDEVRQHEVDDAIAATEGDGRLGTIEGERREPRAFAPGHDQGEISSLSVHFWLEARPLYRPADEKGLGL